MKLFGLIFLAFSISCSVQRAQVPIPIPEETIPEPPIEEVKSKPIQTAKSIEEKLKYYFYGREIVPSIIVNNTEREQTEIKLENSKIKWIRGEKETKIKINGDIFSLKNQKTLNDVSGKGKDDVDFADNWEQIKLYRFGDRELNGISMGNEHCTGIGCRVAFQLIYDLKTKSKTFFGTYRIEREVSLYDFRNDGTLDYLGKTYGGGSDGVIKEIINLYKLYTMDEKGVFHLQLDKNQKPYFMKRTFEPESYEETNDKFEANWIEEIR